MYKYKYYASSDNNLFFSLDSKSRYEEALYDSEDPIKKIEADQGVWYDQNSCWIYIAGELQFPKDGNVEIYNAGYKTRPNSIPLTREFISFELANEYENRAQKVANNWIKARLASLPDVEIPVTINKKYKDTLVNSGWVLWKEQKPPVGEVLVFSKESLGNAVDHVYLDSFNGKKFRITYASNIVAWKVAPTDFPIDPEQFWNDFKDEKQLKMFKIPLWKKCHFEIINGLKKVVCDEEELYEEIYNQ